jgi:hypothetical protein
MKKIILALLLLLLIFAQIVSANAAVTIQDVDKKIVVDYLVKDWLTKGFSILSTTDYQISFRKSNPDTKFEFWFGVNSEARAIFNIVQNGNDVLVTHEFQAVSDAGSGRERTTVLERKEMQEYLNRVKYYFNGRIGYGLTFAKSKDGLYQVSSVYDGSNAKAVGIEGGDIVTGIDGKSTEGMEFKEFNDLFSQGAKGQTLTLKIKKPSGEEKVIKITKDYIRP